MEEHNKAQVSCKFSKGAIIQLVENFGLKKAKMMINEINIKGIKKIQTFNLLTDEHNWIEFSDMLKIIKFVKSKIPSKELEKRIIEKIIKGEIDYPLITIVKFDTTSFSDENKTVSKKNKFYNKLKTTLSSIFFSNPSILYKLTPKTIKVLTKGIFEIKTEITGSTANVFYQYYDHTKPEVIETMCELNRYALQMAPTSLNFPEAQTEEKYCVRKIEDILTNEACELSEKPIDFRIEDNLFISNKKYGEKVKFHNYFNNEIVTGIKIIKDFSIGEKKLLRKGRIYNAPYCAYQARWKKRKPYFLIFIFLAIISSALNIDAYYLMRGDILWLDIFSSIVVFLSIIFLGILFNQSQKFEASLELLRDQDRALKSSYNQLEKYNLELEKKVEARTAELRRLNQAQTDFLLNIAHSLQSPLAITKGNLEMINEEIYGKKRKGEADKKVLDYAGIIEKAATRLSALINDLLELARMDFGKLKLKKDELQLNALLKEIKEEFEILAIDKGLKFDFMIPKRKMRIEGDRKYLKEAVSNLLSNALKYTMDGGIEVALSQKGKNAIIDVKDTGIGIPADEAKDVFKKFFRASNVPRGRGAGTGLGMSIVKWIVENHRGKITFKTKEDKGTTFTIAIPLKRKRNKKAKK